MDSLDMRLVERNTLRAMGRFSRCYGRVRVGRVVFSDVFRGMGVPDFATVGRIFSVL